MTQEIRVSGRPPTLKYECLLCEQRGLLTEVTDHLCARCDDGICEEGHVCWFDNHQEQEE